MPYHFGPFRLDLDNATLWQGDTQLTLRTKTFDLLTHLVCHAGELVTKDELMEAVWADLVVSDSALTASMSEVRRVLGETAKESQYIATVYGRGYRFVATVVVEDVPLSTPDPQPRGRRLAAILSADVQGYSRLIEHDVEATVQTLTDYRTIMTTLIEHHHGRVVNAPGDNLLAEFPSVIEAVQSAVTMQQELSTRNQSLPPERQMRFRMGVNLGDVLFDGDDLYGDGVNIAARLESLAEGGGICISGTIYDQIGSQLELSYTDLGERRVKNIARPVRVYRVDARAEPIDSPEPLITPTSLTMGRTQEFAEAVSACPPVGLISRETEFAQLHTCFLNAQQGQRQVVFITGEAGIGKTTLVDAFVEQIASSNSVWIARGQCIEHYGVGEPYLPLLEALGRLGRGTDGDFITTGLHQHAPSWLLQLPSLVPDMEIEVLHRRASRTTRDRMLRELAEAMEALTVDQMLILVLEDLHWSDTATLDWLTYIVRRRDPARLLILGTYRPVEAIVQSHSVRLVADDLYRYSRGLEISLEYFSIADVEVYLRQRFGELVELSHLIEVLHHRTGGSPLFIATLIDHLVHQGVLEQTSNSWILRGSLGEVTGGIPDNLRRLLEQQLHSLSTEDRQRLEVASVAGVEFTVAAIASSLDENIDTAEEKYQTLARKSLFIRPSGTDIWPDGTISGQFSFIHDLYREIIYECISPPRRVRLHRQIGERLETGYGTRRAEISVELALHFERGQELERAVPFLEEAGARALRRSAPLAAVAQLEHGLELVQRWPNSSARSQQEFRLLQYLCPALLFVKGYADPDVEQMYQRALALCDLTGQDAGAFAIRRGLWLFYLVRADYRVAQGLAARYLHLAETQGSGLSQLQAHTVLGVTAAHLGELKTASVQFQTAITCSEESVSVSSRPHEAQDYTIICLAHGAWILWVQGYPNQATQNVSMAVQQADEIGSAFSQVIACFYASLLGVLAKSARQTQYHAEASSQLATENGFTHWIAYGRILQGWSQAVQESGEDGLEQLREGLAEYQALGAKASLTLGLALLAERYLSQVETEAGFTVLAEAFQFVEQYEERFYESELFRLKGELFLAQGAGATSQAETSFEQALHVAQRQGALMFELRAAVSLGRLWQSQGRKGMARDLLNSVYNNFTEGHNTADLREAKALIVAFAE